MTKEQIQSVLRVYEQYLEGRPADEYNNHLRSMIDRMWPMLEQGKIEKAFRWLGFIQGVLWIQKDFNLEELKDHNRS